MRKQQAPIVVMPHPSGRDGKINNTTNTSNDIGSSSVVKGRLITLLSSDFGVEIVGSRDYEELPRYRRGADKRARKLCVRCRKYRALFKHGGRVRFDRRQDLCARCFRAAIDRLSATLLGA
jgi:hypothetical protein